MGKEHGDPNSKAFAEAYARIEETAKSAPKVLPIVMAKKRVTGAELQAWTDSLAEEQQAMLRVIMERCVMQGRIEALSDATDAVARVGRSLPRGEAQKALTSAMALIMRGRMQALEEMKARGFG